MFRWFHQPCRRKPTRRLEVEGLETRLTPTQIRLFVNPTQPCTQGTALNATATVTDDLGTPVGIGGVSLTLDGGATQSPPLTFGAVFHATFDSTNLIPGPHTVAAHYSGGFPFLADASTSANVTVLERTAVTVQVENAQGQPISSLPVNTPLQLVANVVPARGSDPVPRGGTISFSLDNQPAGQLGVNSNGFAAVFRPSLPAGVHQLTASYSGDLDPAAGVFAAASPTSAPAPFAITLLGANLTLTSSDQPAAPGEAVTILATVAGSTGQAPPTGTVTFTQGSTTETVQLVHGSASFAAGVLPAGASVITATYSGDSSFNAASARLVQTVLRAPSPPTLQAIPSPAAAGTGLTLVATVTDSNTIGTIGAGADKSPGGTVTFLDSGTPVGTAPLTNGQGSLALAPLSPGPHHLVARYNGDSVFGQATSAELLLTGVATPAGPQDVTGLVSVTFGKGRRRGRLLRQTLILTNHSAAPILGPMVLVLDGLSSGITLRSAAPAAGLTRASGGRTAVIVLDQGTAFGPDSQVRVTLVFRATSRRVPRFTPLVLAGAGLG
jgi:hypothetical protein